jgi:nitrous oxide reductase
MNRRSLLFALPGLVCLATSALAQTVNNLPPMTAVTFAPGSTSTTLAGELAPGARRVYYVLAKAGQSLNVSVMPVSTGITFQVFRADAALAKGVDGMAVVTGGTLPDAGPGDAARAWIGAVPRDGNYPILVTRSASAGPGPYNLTVSLQ